MKRVLSLLLILCMLASLLPVTVAVSASAPTTQATGGTEGKELSSFADLYATRGLVARFDAMGTAATVNLTGGTWTASDGNATATLEGTLWQTYAGGGVGYDLLAGVATLGGDGTWSFDSNTHYNLDEKPRLNFDIGLLPDGDYTVEWFAEHKHIVGANADGTPNPAAVYTKNTFWASNGSHPTTVIGTLKDAYDRSGTTLGERGTTRWFLAADGQYWGNAGNPNNGYNNGQLWTELSRTGFDAFVQTVTRTEASSATGTAATLKILKNGAVQKTGSYDTALELTGGINPSKYFKETADSLFYLFYREPVTVYSVRIYSVVLTEKEMEGNRLADILLKSGVDFSVYANLAEGDREDFLSLVGNLGFGATAEDIEHIADNLAEMREQEAIARKMTVYDGLYVGADGAKTQNGGKLTALLSAYDHASVLLSDVQKVWFDKVGEHDATLIGSLWQPQSGGGVGYGMTVGVATKQSDGSYTYDEARHSNYKEDVYLDFGIDALPKEDFTVEYTVQYRRLQGTDAAGNPIVDYTGDGFWGGVLSDAIGQLKAVYERGMGTAISGHYYTRYFTAPAREGWYGGNYLNNQLWMETSRTATTAFTQQIVRDKTEEGANVRLTYQIMKNGVLSKTGVYNSTGALSTAKVQGDKCYTGEEADTVFFLFRRAPVNVYAIRIYDAVLTEEEMLHNHYVDILAYAGLDVAEYYTNLDAEARAFVANFLKESTLLPKAEAEAAIKEALDVCTYSWSKEDSLYVTEGLVGLLSSYNGFSTPTLFGEGSVNWTNVAKEGSFGVLYGKGWQRSADGGLQIRETVDAVYAEKSVFSHHRSRDNFYLGLDYSLLPERDYTLEVVTAPEGITIQNEDGSISPYVDYFSTYGIYNERTFSIGPLRCMGYACNSHVSSGSFEKWFVYQSKGCWDDTSSRNQIGRDRTFQGIELGKILTYTIDHDFDEEEGSARYVMSRNNVADLKASIPASAYIAPSASAEKDFYLMRGLASTLYSVRLYNRVLTDAEKLQNRVADVCYYFDLDTELLEEALASIPDKATVFAAFTALSFDMTKEEAQKALNDGMAGIWVRSQGVGIKKDMSDAIRFYFDLQYSSLAAIMAAGFEVELGTLVGIGRDERPTADGAYDYRFVAFDSTSGANTAYLLDEDTYAVTVTWRDADSDLYNEKLRVVTYVKLTARDSGEVSYFYGGLSGSAYSAEPSLFVIYNHLSTAESMVEAGLSDYLSMTAGGCYEEETVYLSATAPNGGNGSQDAPYNDFGTAFEAAKQILAASEKPLRLSLFVGDGAYMLDEIVSLDFDEIQNPYYSFSIEGDFEAEELPSLTSAVNIPASAFQAVAGRSGLYVYEFAPDGKGNYPVFRNFYVDGFTATMAHSGVTSTMKGTPLLSRFSFSTEGTYERAKYYYEAGTLAEKLPENEYDADRPDLKEAYARHRDWFLAYDEVKKGQGVLSDDAFDAWTADSAASAAYKEAFNYFKERYADVRSGAVKASAVSYTLTIPDSKAEQDGRIFVPLSLAESLRASTEAMLTALKAEKSLWEEIATAQEAVVAEKTTARNTAKAALDAAVASGGNTADASAAYQAAETALAEAQAVLTELRLNVYDAATTPRTVLRHGQIELSHSIEWCYNLFKVVGIDFDDTAYYGEGAAREELVAVYVDKTQYVSYAGQSDLATKNRQVFLQNAPEFLDETGEYYYDIASGKLYYYSESGIADDMSFAYPTLDNLLVFTNAKNLTLSGLTLWGVDNTAYSVYGICSGQAGGNNAPPKGIADEERGFTKHNALLCYNAYNLTVADCYFRDLGADGIGIRGRAENVTVEGCEFETLGGTAIRFTGSERNNTLFNAESGAQGVTLKGNYIHEVALTDYASPAIYMASCKDVEVANNTIIGCSYSGMSFGWSWSAATWEEGDNYNLYNMNIHHNYVTQFMREMEDGGAIYMLGGNLKPDNPKQINFIHHNLVVFDKHTGNGLGGQSDGYYFDGASTNWSNYNNIAVMYSAGADRGAKPGASPEDYTHYLRSNGVAPFFMQYTTTGSAWSYNIHSTDNYVFNVRATTPTAQQNECFHMGKDAHWQACGHKVVGTRYFAGDSKLAFPNAIKSLIAETGAPMHPGEWEWLLSNEY